MINQEPPPIDAQLEEESTGENTVDMHFTELLDRGKLLLPSFNTIALTIM